MFQSEIRPFHHWDGSLCWQLSTRNVVRFSISVRTGSVAKHSSTLRFPLSAVTSNMFSPSCSKATSKIWCSPRLGNALIVVRSGNSAVRLQGDVQRMEMRADMSLGTVMPGTTSMSNRSCSYSLLRICDTDSTH